MALTGVALTGTAQAADFAITASNGTINGNVAADAIDGSDTITLGIALTTKGIATSGGTNGATVSENGSITTAGT